MDPDQMTTRRRILFTGVPAYGHLLPMLPLARAAIRAGHDVRIATGPDLVGPLLARQLPAYAAGPTFAQMRRIRAELVPDLPELKPDEQIAASAEGLFGRPARSRLRDLERMASRWRPDLVVHDTLELAGPMLARRLGVPGVTHGYGPMFAEYDAFGAVAASAAGERDLWDHLRGGWAIDICPPSLRPAGEPIWLDAVDLRPTAGEPGGRGLPEQVLRLLDTDLSPLVYLTLGTISGTDGDSLATAVEAVRELPVRLVVTTGPDVEPATLGAQPANVAVASFIPQTLLLERADLLVSQTGAGTMLGALCHGLPQVCLPRGADQPWNAASVERTGAATVVPEEEFSVGSIRAAVEGVLEDPSYADGARRVQAEIDAMPAAGGVLPELLDGLADEMAA